MEGRLILLLSGPVAAGKSTLSKALVENYGFKSIRSGRYLQTLAQDHTLDVSRQTLQMLGDGLDDVTDFAWLIDDVAAPLIDGEPNQTLWLLDSVRKARQVEHFRARFRDDVLHVHVVAPEEELRRRYEERLTKGGEYEGGTPYDEAITHPNEVSSRALGKIADLIVNTSVPGAIDGKLATSF